MQSKQVAKKERSKRNEEKKETAAPRGGGGEHPVKVQISVTDLPAENLSQMDRSDAEQETEEGWALQEVATGRIIYTFPAKPRDGKEALLIVPGCEEWDDAARKEAHAMCKRFSTAWHELITFTKIAFHKGGRDRLGRFLGRFYAKIAEELAHAEGELNDFSELYYGRKFFGEDGSFPSKNGQFRKSFDKHRKSPVKRGDRVVAHWVRGQLNLLEYQGHEIYLHVKETRKWPTAHDMDFSPSWTPHTFRFAELGFRLTILLQPPHPLPDFSTGELQEDRFGFETLWRELLEPHFSWAWPEFMREKGDRLRKGKGYARKDFGHHASTVKRFCREGIATWDSGLETSTDKSVHRHLSRTSHS